MKKILSLVIALVLIVSSFAFSTTGFASMEKSNSYTLYADGEYDLAPTEFLQKQKVNANGFVFGSSQTFDCNNAVDFLTYINSGVDFSSYKDAFSKSVVDNLKENNGKLLMSGKESIGLYGAVIQILEKYGYDAKNFNGYNIVSAFQNINISKINDNPYYYRIAVEASKLCNLDFDFVKELINSFIDTYYVFGKGMNYYGYSCDNTATFVTTLAPYKEEYKNYVDDAVKILESYKTNTGYFSSSLYSVNANADSTALALMAYASVGDMSCAYDAYDMLCSSFEVKTGVFGYINNTTENKYATKDALLALEYYGDLLNNLNNSKIHYGAKWVVDKNATCTEDGFRHTYCVACGEKLCEKISSTSHQTETTLTRATLSSNGSIAKKCTDCGKTISYETIYFPKQITISKTRLVFSGKALQKPTVTIKSSNNQTIPSTNYSVSYISRSTGKTVSSVTQIGYYKVKIVFKGNYSGTAYKYFYVAPKNAALKSLSTSSKSVTAKWSQDRSVSGYQVVISKYSSFKNAKCYTVKGNSATSKKISSLAKNTKYYVKVRSYKTVKCDGKSKNIYGEYSLVKSVKCK